MEKAAVYGHNDVALLAWSYDEAIADCLGFAVYRTDTHGHREPLPAWVGFEGGSNKDWKPSTTEVWPVQKFSWRDLTARHGATYTYEIVPMIGAPGNLQPLTAKKLTTGPVHLTPERSTHVRTYFNRGILSTQHLAHELPQGPDGAPVDGSLLPHIENPADPIRKSLAGQIVEGVSLLLKRAKKHGGRCYCALYELNDPELVPLLEDTEHVSLILSNAGDGDATDADARAKLHGLHVDVTDRMLPGRHIGHNKFVVYEDEHGVPQSVLSGSTNWTYTGLCGQTNNAIVIDDPELAQIYREYWNRIKAECPPPADPPGAATQSADYRQLNDAGHSFTVDGRDGRVWFSPNTKQHTKPKPPAVPDRPHDLAEVDALIAGANEGILFLVFQPGTPNVLDAILDRQAAKPDLFVRGAATDPKAIEDYTVTLFHRTGETAHVAAASAVEDQFAFWQKELLKSSSGAHAIVHDKIVVIDPLSDGCVVITGSHNLGYTASYANDENLLIVKGHRPLAEAYAVHVMDVYDHYRWRWYREKHGGNAYKGLRTTAAWQDGYFAKPSLRAEVEFWLSA